MTVQRISDWRSGRHRPKDFDTVKPLLEWLTARALARGEDQHLLTVDEWKFLWDKVPAGSTGSAIETTDIAPESHFKPFLGLRALTANDSTIYFGRSEVIENLRAVIEDAASTTVPIVIVTGPSGAGKSSLLGAGLAICDGVEVVDHGRPLSHRGHEFMVGTPAKVSGVTDIPVLVIDQFEECFAALDLDPDIYVDRLLEVARQSGLVVVVGVRADFFDRCVTIPTLARAWQSHCIIVPPMTDRQLREVITGPARLAGCRVDGGLADLMIADVHQSVGAGNAAGRLPLLAHVLQATWARRSNGRMTVSGYRATGGVASAVAETAERAWATVEQPDHSTTRALLLALTYPGPDDRRIRSSLSPDEVVERFGAAGVMVVEAFVSERLLAITGERIEFVHDIVLDAWPRLRQWLAEDRAAAVVRRDVDNAAQSWLDGGRHPDFLYSSTELAIVSTAVSPGDKSMSKASAAQFLHSSERHVRRRARARKVGIAGMVLLVIASMVAASIAVLQTRTAAAERDDADFRAIMSQLPTLRTENPSLAAELTLVAHRQRPHDRTVVGDLINTAGTPLQSTLPGHSGAIYGVAYSPNGALLASAGEDRTLQLWRMAGGHPIRAGTFSGYKNYVTSVSFDTAAPVLATGSGDGTVRIINVSDPDHPVTVGLPLQLGHGTVYNVVFSPDGRTLAVPSDDGSVSLIDITNPANPRPWGPPLLGHTGAVRTVAFSPDSKLLATGSDDTTTRLWSVADPAHAAALPNPIRGLNTINHSVSFDGTGTRLAITGDAPQAQIWDVADPIHPRPINTNLPSVTGNSWSIAFGPRPGQLAAAGLDGVIHVWDVRDPARVSTAATLSAVSQRQPGAFSLQYSPDGTALAGGYADGSIRIWRFANGDLNDRAGSIGSVTADRTHQLIATTGDDGTLHLLHADPSMVEAPRQLSSIGIDHRVNDRSAIAITGDGTQVATANNNGGRVQIWDTRDPNAPRHASDLRTDTRYTNQVAFSPASATLAVNQTDTTVALWDTREPRAPVLARSALVGPTDLITGLAFDPTGRLLAVSSDDQTVRIFDLSRDDPHAVATISTGSTTPPVFAPIGSLLIVGAPSGVALWDLRQPAAPHILSTIGELVPTSLAVSPDSERLAVGTAQGGLIIDDISDPAQPRLLSDSVVDQADGRAASENARWHTVFAADSQALLAGFSNASALRERTLDVDTALSRICQRIGDPPSREEWDQTITGVAYQTPCVS
ncbi:MAG: hypothetical protein ACOH2Q_21980 [Rhodococcus sp. (in: high G+C Gram-positive bacteria)]